MLLIALCFAELGALFPRSGALVHMSHASHGEGLGRIWGWMLFLACVPVPAVEAEAVVTYANNYLPYLIQPHSTGLLTPIGFAACADPTGYSFTSIFAALPSAGVVFSYLGFRTAIDLGGESANPHRDIPLAVIGSVILAAAIYILLQFAFLLALALAFICSDLVVEWTGFHTNCYLFGIVAVGFIIYVGHHRWIARLPSQEIGWRHIAWLLPWFGDMWVLSWLSDIGGGAGIIGFWAAVVLVIIWSLIVMRLALATALPPAETQAIMARMNAV